jgi:hypothetical protein
MPKESKHILEFTAHHAGPTEDVIAYCTGFLYKGDKLQNDGVLIVTNSRVAFYRKGITGEIFESIPIKNITSIERKAPMLGLRSITLHTSHDSLEFRAGDKSAEAEVAEAIERVRSAGDKPSGLDSLSKLAELKAAGILTEEEFNAKKKQILSTI